MENMHDKNTIIKSSYKAPRKPVEPVSTRYTGYTWYEICAIIIFIGVFIYIAAVQFSAIEDNISLISCRSSRNRIATAVSEFRADFPEIKFGHPKKAVQIEKLVENKYLRYSPKCWSKGIYKLNSHDDVYCTYHNPELEETAQVKK